MNCRLMTPDKDHAMTASSQIYVDNQTILVSLIEQMRAFIKKVHRPNPEDKFILHYPTNMDITSPVCTPICTNGGSYGYSSMIKPVKFFILGPSMDILQHSLDDQSMAKILADKLGDSLNHLEKLKQRVCEKTSKILVTGDVNAGKSTFVNSLLGAEVLPTDQQPCTQSFCEVIPTPASGKLSIPMVHAAHDLENYASTNEKSFHEMSVEEMQESIQHEEPDYNWYRLFWPIVKGTANEKRFTAGKVLDVSLIDSPGLNSDLFKTTSLFSKQADIDVVVFVINAANHLTLSAREFLERASKEKDYIFIVVNKFDDIKNRDKCKRIILQQISEVLPATGNESSELIHFVSALNYMRGVEVEPFVAMEECLKNFILEKRTTSKLLPVFNYIRRLSTDLEQIIEDNLIRSQKDLDRVSVDLEMISPCYEELLAHDLPFRNAIQGTINQTSSEAYEECMKEFLYDCSRLGADVHWQGLLGIWTFRKAVMEHVKQELSSKLSLVCNNSAKISSNGLHKLNALACTHAGQVFGSSNDLFSVSEQQIALKYEVIEQIRWDLGELAPWDVIDFGEEVSSAKTWIGASAIGAAIFGYRPLLSLGLNTMDLVVRGRSKTFYLVGLVGGAVAIGLFFVDLESMVRRRLTCHIREVLGGGQIQNGAARRIEGVTREILMEASLGLVGRFEEAIGNQRRLRAEKDMERRRCESVLAHFQRHRDTLRGLRLQIEQVEMG